MAHDHLNPNLFVEAFLLLQYKSVNAERLKYEEIFFFAGLSTNRQSMQRHKTWSGGHKPFYRNFSLCVYAQKRSEFQNLFEL